MTLHQDLRFAIRMLGKSPAFTAAAVLTLALGIGANTAIFTVANALLLRPLPYRQPDRLAFVSSFNLSNPTTYGVFSVPDRGEPEQLASARVSQKFFDVLAVQPALGRSFLPEEDQPGGRPVVL